MDDDPEKELLRRRCARAEQRAEGFAQMFHDVRTLVGSVSGLSTMVLTGDLTEAQRHHVKRIRATSASLTRLVNGALDLSKVEAGQVASAALAANDFDLRRKLEDVLALAADRAQAKGICLVSAVEPDVPTALRGDDGRLEQILLNLVVNAVRFTEHGSVTLVARRCQFDDAEGIGHLTIDVVDTGTGMTPEVLARVFEPYQQGAVSAATAGGTGLGLTIVKGLVSVMGGTVTCTSEQGLGSTFTRGYRVEEGRLAPGEMIAVVSDGLTEPFGFMDEIGATVPRLLAAVVAGAPPTPADLGDVVRSLFAGHAAQPDDATALLLGRSS